MTQAFHERIAAMNAMYKLPANSKPAVPDEVADGAYLLQLTMPALPGDAVLSSPLLFRVAE